MMAKMFYTMEEAKATLGKSEEEVKQYAREGRLREFRDGPRLMFKADQVEQLKSELESGGGGSVPDLGVSDSGGLIGLVDTTGASGTSITLSEADTGQSSVAGLGGLGGSASGIRLSPGASGSGPAINLANTGTGMGLSGTGVGGSVAGGSMGGSLGGSAAGMSGSGISLKGDTGLAADLGLSGSLGGVPSPGRPGGTGAGLTGAGMTGTGSRAGGGINVFGPDDEGGGSVDPGAQTAISGGLREQVNLEGVGSGSGLLDLTRESDDTSLGAVLDEITPGGTAPGRRALSDTGAAAGTGIAGLSEVVSAPTSRRAAGVAPVYVQQLDPAAAAFGGLALGGAIMLMYGIFVLIAALVGTRPAAATYFAKQAFYIPFAIGLGVALVLAVFGLIIGKMGRR
jgi:hypothetical protein